MVIDWMYGAAAQSGWWMGPYSTGGDSPRGHPAQHRRPQEQRLACSVRRARPAAPPARPRAAPTPARTSTARSTGTCGRTGRACGTSTRAWTRSWRSTRRPRPTRPRDAPTRTVLRGSYPWPLTPSVGANPNDQPDVDTPLAARILDPGPCGYYIPQAEYDMPRTSTEATTAVPAGSVAERLAIHGIKVEPQAGGVLVRLKQPLRGLIAPLLDSASVLPMHGDGPAPLPVPAGRRPGRRHGAGDPGPDPRPGRAVRPVHPGRGQGVHRQLQRDDRLDRRRRDAVRLRRQLDRSGPPGQRRVRAGQRRSRRRPTPARSPRSAAPRPPTALLTYSAPVSNDVVTLGFKQVIGANEAAAHRHLREDVHVHAVDDEPVVGCCTTGGALAPALGAGLETMGGDAGHRGDTAVVEANYDWTFVRVDAEGEGLSGIGECFCAPGLTAIIKELAPLLIGEDARDVDRLWAKLRWGCSGAGSSAGIVYNAISGHRGRAVGPRRPALRRADLPPAGRQVPRLRPHVRRLPRGRGAALDERADDRAPRALGAGAARAGRERRSCATPSTAAPTRRPPPTRCSRPSSTPSGRSQVVADLGFSALKFDLDVPTPYMQDTASGTLIASRDQVHGRPRRGGDRRGRRRGRRRLRLPLALPGLRRAAARPRARGPRPDVARGPRPARRTCRRWRG